ncbi:MAG: sporulation protein YqfD [Huintestinicola sp.]
MKLYRLKNRVGFCIFSESMIPDFGKLINTLRGNGVHFYGLSVKHDKLYGYTRRKDFELLSELSEKQRLTVEITDKQGVFYSTKPFHLRFGFLIGLAAAVVMISFLSDRCMIIEISGNEALPDSRILSLLKDCGIYTGSSLSDVDLRRAEQEIVGMEDGISWIGIRNTGSRVVVEVSEITEKPQMEHKNSPCNIVAAHDAQIKNVKVYSGMLEAMVGDGVKKGDVIVSGTVDTKYGRSYYVHSIAEITGVYTEKMTFSQNFVTEELVPDEEICRRCLRFFNMRIPLDFGAKIGGQYEYYEEEKPVTLNNITFPLSVIDMHYTLLRSEEVIRSEAETEELLHEKIARYEQDLLSDSGGVITDKQIKKETTDEGMTLSVTYTIEGEIGTERRLFAKYEPADYPYEHKDEDK